MTGATIDDAELDQPRYERDECELGDRVNLHDGTADPVTIVAGEGTPTSDVHLLLERLRSMDYEIGIEYEGAESGYCVHFPAEGGHA